MEESGALAAGLLEAEGLVNALVKGHSQWDHSLGHSTFQFFQLAGQLVQSLDHELGQSVGQSILDQGASRTLLSWKVFSPEAEEVWVVAEAKAVPVRPDSLDPLAAHAELASVLETAVASLERSPSLFDALAVVTPEPETESAPETLPLLLERESTVRRDLPL